MSFLSPWSWLWLLPPAAAVILLYLLKLKRLPRVVSSVMLWTRLIADLQANAPFQKLRRNLLLYLQLLALLAMVAALARPFVRVKGLEGQSIVLILDTSASMNATDVSGGRFAAARGIALKAVDDLGRGDTMAVIAASAETRVISPFTSDRRALAAGIRSLECTDTTTHLDDAVRLADSLAARKRSPQIVVVSDGAFAPLSRPLASHARLSFIRVGRRSDNLAITALGARRSLAGANRYELLVTTESFSRSPSTFTVEISRGGQLLDAREQTLVPGGKGNQVFTIPEAGAGLATVRLDVSDDLAADNAAHAFLAPRREASALLITRGDLFLERALALDPSLTVAKAAAAPARGSAYDLVIVEGPHPGPLPPARGYLFINAAGDPAPVDTAGEIARPTITDWSRTHPVTRYLDLSGVHIARSRRATLKPWARALAETASGPLIAAGERDGVRSVYLGWDLLQSDFPLRVAFPIFVANCVDWLMPPAGPGQGAAVRAGQVVSVAVPPGLTALRLTDPAGRTSDLSVDQNPLSIRHTSSAGVYTLEGKGFRQQFAVNLLSREESNLQPSDQLSVGGKQASASHGAVLTNRELWRWLVLLALCLVTLEWVAYHRRP